MELDCDKLETIKSALEALMENHNDTKAIDCITEELKHTSFQIDTLLKDLKNSDKIKDSSKAAALMRFRMARDNVKDIINLYCETV